MKYLKKNKIYLVGIVIFLIAVIAIIIALWDILIPNDGSVYGNRLDNIEEYMPNDTVFEEIKSDLISNDHIKEVEYTISGKILNFMIDVEVGTDKISSVSFANKILEHLSEDAKNYFDIQVYFTCKTEELAEGDESIYPFIAYKHRTATVFTTTNTD